MKRKYILLLVSTIIILSTAYIYIPDSLYKNKAEDSNVSMDVYSSKSNKVSFIVYIPNLNDETLIPKNISINSKGNLYYNLIDGLMKESREVFKSDVKLKSVKKQKNTIKVKFNDNFKNNLPVDEKKQKLLIMSVVNTLYEFSDVDSVEIYSGNEKVNIKNTETFKGDFSLINIKKFNSPDKALREQMKLEQKGNFLESYLLMNYKKSKDKKIFYEYEKEMNEIKELGFLSSDFRFKNITINNNTASIDVEFLNMSSMGESLNPEIISVKCIKIEDFWLVEW